MWRGSNVGGAISYAVIGRRRVFIFIQIPARRLDVILLESGHDTAVEETVFRNDTLHHGALILCKENRTRYRLIQSQTRKKRNSHHTDSIII